MAYPTLGSSTINMSRGVTVVDCQKQVSSWRLLRSLVETLIPCCNGTSLINEDRSDQYHHQTTKHSYNFYHYPQPSTTSNIITGTIFGCRKGKVSFCIQTTSKNNKNPTLLLLLELAVSTQTLAREMQGGFLRIALESNTTCCPDHDHDDDLLSTPVWTMYCNGRRVGYAVKRRPTEADSEVLSLMSSLGASGAGVIRGKELKHCENEIDDDNENYDVMYLRAKFERICGSANSESFHLIDPDRCIGQELSIFFYRSQ